MEKVVAKFHCDQSAEKVSQWSPDYKPEHVEMSVVQGQTEEDKVKKAEEELKVKIDECLTGAKNASKIFYTKFAVDMEGKPLPGWKINELKNDIKDTAWLNGFEGK